jgi:hypothetical protein
MPYFDDGIYFADGSTPMVSSQISYDEMSSAGDAIQAVERNIPIKVASSSERNTKYPTPDAGDAVWRSDIGVEQRYSASTPAGWYSATTGLMNVKPTGVVFGGGSASGSVSESGLITFNTATGIYVNGIFGPAFKNYKIFINLQSTSAANTNMWIQYAANGVADSSANYYRTNLFANSGTVAGAYTPNSTTGILAIWNASAVMRSGLAEITLYNPYLGKPTSTHQTLSAGPGITPSVLVEGNYFNSATASFDGFYASSQSAVTLTGSMLVYGFN